MYFVCLLLKADLYTSDGYMACMVMLRYFVYFIALTNHDSVLGKIKSMFISSAIFVVISSHLVFWLVAIWIAISFARYYRHPDTFNFSEDSQISLVQLMTKVKSTQQMVLPVLYLATVLWIFDNYSQVWQSVLLAILLLLATVLTNISLYLLTDTMPRDKLFALMDCGHEVIFYTLNKIILTVALLSDLKYLKFAKVYIQSSICLVLGGLALYNCFRVKYWSEKANMIVMGLHLFLFVCSLLGLSETLGVHQGNALMVACICYPIVLKGGINNVKRNKLCRPFEQKNLSNVYAAAAMDKTLRETDRSSKGNAEYRLYYQGLISDLLKSSKNTKLMKDSDPVTMEDIDKALVQISEKKILSLSSLKLVYYYFLKFPYHNFSFCSIFLSRMKTLMNTRYYDRLQWFYFKLLLESKFEATYFLKDTDQDKSTDLYGLYRHIAITSNRPPSKEYVNVNYPLQCKRVYLIFVDRLKLATGIFKELFNYLITSRSSNKSVSIHRLWMLNEKLVQTTRKVSVSLRFLQANIPKPPQYYYPALYSYYAGIMYDSIRGSQMLQLFRSGRCTWNLIKSKIKAVRTSEENVVLEMTTAKQNVGEIIDATPNAESLLLVKPGQKAVIGRHCNELFAQFLKIKHIGMMSNMTAVDKIVNAKGGFFMELFDKSLKEVDFQIKFAFHIEKYPSILASIKVINRLNNQFFLITSMTADVYQAEDGFWKAIGKKRSEEKFNLNSLSKRITKMSKIIKIVMELAKFEQSDSRNTSFSSTLRALLNKVLELNSQSCLYFTADHGSEASRIFGNLKMLIRFEPGTFGDSLYFKMYITFENTHMPVNEALARSDFKRTPRNFIGNTISKVSHSSDGSFKNKKGFPITSYQDETQAFSGSTFSDVVVKDISTSLHGLKISNIDLFVGEWKTMMSELVNEVAAYERLVLSDLESRTGSPTHLKSASRVPLSFDRAEKIEPRKKKEFRFNVQMELNISQEIKEETKTVQNEVKKSSSREHDSPGLIQKKTIPHVSKNMLTIDSLKSDDNRLSSQSLTQAAKSKKNMQESNNSYVKKSSENTEHLKSQISLNKEAAGSKLLNQVYA